MSVFDAAMRLMRKRNPQLREDGFAMLRPLAAEYLGELMKQFAVEHDHGPRCWLLELIGEARSPEAFGLLAAELHSDDEALREWAAQGLRLLGTKEARRVLWETRGTAT